LRLPAFSAVGVPNGRPVNRIKRSQRPHWKRILFRPPGGLQPGGLTARAPVAHNSALIAADHAALAAEKQF
jgi:hypothetical protein